MARGGGRGAGSGRPSASCSSSRAPPAPSARSSTPTSGSSPSARSSPWAPACDAPCRFRPASCARAPPPPPCSPWPPRPRAWRPISSRPGSQSRIPVCLRRRWTARGRAPRGPFFPSSAETNVGGSGALQLLHEEPGLRPLPQGHLRPVELVGPPLRLLQQPVVPQVDRVHAGRRGHEAVEVVRGLPRPRGRLRRQVRHADQGSRSTPRRRRSGSACTSCHSIVHVKSTMGQGDFTIEYPPLHDLATSDNPVPPRGPRLPAEARPRPALAHVPEELPHRRDAAVLLGLPQGPPRRAGQRLPLDPRLQRVRQLAGLGRLGGGGALVLLPGEAAELRRLPHAARALRGPRGAGRQDPLAPLPGREHRAAVREPRRGADARSRRPSSSRGR